MSERHFRRLRDRYRRLGRASLTNRMGPGGKSKARTSDVASKKARGRGAHRKRRPRRALPGMLLFHSDLIPLKSTPIINREEGHTDRGSHYFHSPKAGGKVDTDLTAGPSSSSASKSRPTIFAGMDEANRYSRTFLWSAMLDNGRYASVNADASLGPRSSRATTRRESCSWSQRWRSPESARRPGPWITASPIAAVLYSINLVEKKARTSDRTL